MIVDTLEIPIVLAPLAGGPSTPRLAASVSDAGGFGFLGAGYLSAQALADMVGETRTLTRSPFGVNLFVPTEPGRQSDIARYAGTLADDALAAGVALGAPRFSDDEWQAKLDLLIRDPVEVVSFAFGCPSSAIVRSLHEVGSEVWVTVTSPSDAVTAEAVGADVLVVQGGEAGGHRGGLRDDGGDPIALLPLLQLVGASTRLPLVATGAIATGAAIAAVLACGARAAALGTAFLRCSEAGTSAVHRSALRGDATTTMTRAFTGRTARGIRNRFIREHSAAAPAAYPEVHYLTAPLRQAGRADGNPELVNLWAGQSYTLSESVPAGELVRRLHIEARTAATRANQRLSGQPPRTGGPATC